VGGEIPPQGETCFKDSFEIFSFFYVIDVDIILYRDICLDKLQIIILYPRFVLIIFSGMTISVVSSKFDADNMDYVENEH
jgi:hypothetical protein